MKSLLFSIAACLFALVSAAQTTTQPTGERKAQKPIIMVVPEKAWCINNGFVKSSDPKSPDYEKALLNDDVLNVITKMGGIMQERGYPLKNLQSALDELKNESAMDMGSPPKLMVKYRRKTWTSLPVWPRPTFWSA